MEASATLRYARVSARKARLVADVVRGKPAGVAVEQLAFLDKKSAPLIAKLIDSAVANFEVAAERADTKVDVDNVVVKRIEVGQGTGLRRFRPRAQGRATPVMKKTSHITVVVGTSAEQEG
jgi:large subunit ribosomal protein L22